jgi:3-oxoadipate enol-lactonase
MEGIHLPEVRVNHLRLHYVTEGDGPAVILLHELGGSTETWKDLQPFLVGAGFRAVALDLRGAGRSELPAAAYSLPDLASDVLGLMDVLGLPQAFLVGLAVGGLVALQVATASRRRVLGLILLDATLVIPEANATYARQRAATVAREGMAAVVDQSLSRSFPAPVAAACPQAMKKYRDRFLRNNPQGYAFASLAALGADFREAAPSLDLPALVLVGEHDRLFPPEQAQMLAEALPQATYHVIPGAGHFPPLQAPEAVRKLVVTFLERCVAGAGRGCGPGQAT